MTIPIKGDTLSALHPPTELSQTAARLAFCVACVVGTTVQGCDLEESPPGSRAVSLR